MACEEKPQVPEEPKEAPPEEPNTSMKGKFSGLAESLKPRMPIKAGKRKSK
jgi:hypothetical protein